MATRWARFARGWVVALFSTFVAGLSHTLGGGAVPSVVAVVLSLAFAGIVCVGLAGRTLSLWRMVVSVLVSQLIFHGLFSFGAPGGALSVSPAAPPRTPASALLGAHEHGAIGAVTALSSAPAGHAGGHDAAWMWAAHAVAAVITIVALRHGESAFWGLFATVRLGIRSLFAALAGVLAGATLPGAPRSTVSTARVFTPRDLALVFSRMRHRGPPALRFA
ncbi:hypothetical protein GCM10022381_31080 [Leifsonia kafniensis]|uniref:MFS transporter n=1 Tax=Leifsonia kafniensis TaxID=475957 RepID=A0ABP7KSI4_9MICO